MERLRTKCPKCFKLRFWKTADGRLRCRNCRHIFTPKLTPFNLPAKLLRQIISEFLLEHSTKIILERINVSKYKLLKTLTLLRIVMTKDVPAVFEGIVEVDETYLGGQMKNRKLKERLKIKKNRQQRQPEVLAPLNGIFCRSGQVWARLINKTEAEDLQPLIEKQVKKGSIIYSDTWRGYTGIALKGYVHRLVRHAENEYTDQKGNHINGLEGF